MACCVARRAPAPSASQPNSSELLMPTFDAVMDSEMRIFALAAFGSSRELKDFLDAVDDADERRTLVNVADPESGTTPLIVGCRRDHSAIVEILLEVGADINQGNKNGWTPRSAAARYAGPKVVQILEQHQATAAPDAAAEPDPSDNRPVVTGKRSRDIA